MFQTFFNSMFGCGHQRTTFPLTPVKRAGATRNDTYVVCLDCGREFTYDWALMRVGRPVTAPLPLRAAATAPLVTASR